MIGTALPFLLGGSLVAIACVLADSLFYKSLDITFVEKPIENLVDLMEIISDPTKWSHVNISGTLVLTPLNNILYNANVENLKEHGLHPRYLHLLVNFPLLYGPLSTGALVSFLWRPRTNATLYYVLVSVVTMAMIGLSIMPHQEARFLAPMLAPIALIYTWSRLKFNRGFMILWISFNIITTVVFGGLHQGGLVPAMIFLQQQVLGMEGCHVLDTGILGCQFGEIGNSDKPKIEIQDFGGQFDSFYEALQERSGIPFTSHSPYMNFAPSKKQDQKDQFERTLVIAPSMALLPRLEDGRYLLLSSFTPHVNFDDIQVLMELTMQGKFSRALISLNVYMVLTDED
ncbi:Alg9-like mannosyltransferase family-domain-containing protein [Phascolomyces articulosus]|uniref:Mannosyltransferase n=1 Tax=Phascolomyces articulosus TaxID=60185 RepID=A0AAD5KRU2_9FUNG|nr:Alg9-like mannosyltransferase family-domain-containing protein [Phascolomyces articulosus]